MKLSEVRAMAELRLAGMSHRPLLLSSSSAEVAVEQAVARVALELEHERLEQQRKALAAEVGNRVGVIVGRAMSQTLQSIARAFSG